MVVDNLNLEIGENEIVIKVTAENGDVKNYKVKVIRKEKSNNTNLKVFYEGKELTFKDDYCETEVDYTTQKLDYRYELEDKNATLEIKDKDSLEVGENVLIFYVTAEDGTKKDYKWTVKRQPKIEAENKKISDEQNNLLILLGAFVIGVAGASLFWKIKVRSDKK